MARSPRSGGSVQQFMGAKGLPAAAFWISAHVACENGDVSRQIQALGQCRRRHNHLCSIRPSEHPLSDIPLEPKHL